MIKKIKIYLTILATYLLVNPFIAIADSGLDSKYSSSASPLEALFSSATSFLSFFAELLNAEPNKKGYFSRHLTLSIICIIVVLIVSWVYLYKLYSKKVPKRKRVWSSLLYSLIPTLLISLMCFTTKWQLILYVFVLIIYLVIFINTIKVILKIRIKKKIKKVKEIDVSFDKKEFEKEAFNIYKEIQLAWMDFKLDNVKDLLSKEIYNQYKEQLKKLKEDNQKNIMEKIDFKSSKITDIVIDNNIEVIDCEMNVTCYDYIIDKEEKVIKGKKDEVCKYTYNLTYNKDLKTNKYTLVQKEMKKQK